MVWKWPFSCYWHKKYPEAKLGMMKHSVQLHTANLSKLSFDGVFSLPESAIRSNWRRSQQHQMQQQQQQKAPSQIKRLQSGQSLPANKNKKISFFAKKVRPLKDKKATTPEKSKSRCVDTPPWYLAHKTPLRSFCSTVGHTSEKKKSKERKRKCQIVGWGPSSNFCAHLISSRIVIQKRQFFAVFFGGAPRIVLVFSK